MISRFCCIRVTSPDPSEIARVTDYVVAYACKENSTLTEEKRQIKQLVLR